jgi:hypothetical protein
MFESLNKVDWDLLNRQKITLLAIRSRQRDGSPESEALSGIIHLLDALQDDAAADGRWTFPGEKDEEVQDAH